MPQQTTRIAPSILSSDFSILGEEIRRIDEAGADYIHIDVMDGHFVPNLTFGPPIIKAIRGVTKKPFDVHLMIGSLATERLIGDFVEAGADIITVHAEEEKHLHRTLQNIKAQGVKCGVSLNPATPAAVAAHVMDLVDLILVMSVNPGFGGQSFIDVTGKIATLRGMIDEAGRAIDLEVDGGVNTETGKLCVEAGADVLVAGSYIFKNGPSTYAEKIKSLKF